MAKVAKGADVAARQADDGTIMAGNTPEQFCQHFAAESPSQHVGARCEVQGARCGMTRACNWPNKLKNIGRDIMQGIRSASAMKGYRRAASVTGIIVGAGLALLSGSAAAQGAAASYPTRTVTVIVPFAPGAGTDIESRLYAQKLSEALGRSFVVDYKPGAGSTIGGAYVAKSAPDGYTLMSATPSNGIASLLYKDLTYDPIKDFAFISMMSKRPSMLIASNKFPPRDVREYMQYARDNPGKINMATSGAGGVAHLSMEHLHHATKTRVTFVHFKGGGPANVSVMSGQVDVVIASVAAMMNQIRAGKARAIGVTSLQRLKLLPDVPTVSEQALQGWEYAQWVGLTAPAATPRPIINKLAGELAKIAWDPELAQKFADDATEMIGNTPEQFTAYVVSEAARWKKLIDDIGIKLD